MRIRILSDLHLEFHDFDVSHVAADVVILAGDIDVEGLGLEWAIKTFPDTPVLYILGNHEYYGAAYPKLVNELKEKARGSNVTIMENDAVMIDEVMFLGCTLWTDFKLYGDPRVAGYEATQIMADYRKIKLSPNYSKLRALDTAAIHAKSLQWLKNQVQAHKGKKVVITHHAPHPESIPLKYKGDLLSAAFASDLGKVLESADVDLWIHGHIHTASDYQLGKTRVLCNPRGYPNEQDTHFIPDLIVKP
jgi:Icc-related predicted phosphoesterase